MVKVELKTKGVAFNVADPQQKELYDHAMKKANFSGYVKHLMLKDMLGLASAENTQNHAKFNDLDSFI